MSQGAKTRQALLGCIFAAAPLGLSACATTADTANAVDAVLLNPQDGPTRQAIRVFVREQSGPSLIVKPDDLALSPVLTPHQRKIDINRRNARQAFKAHGEFRLIMDSNNHCWITHRLQESVSQLQLPASANCAPYQAP